MLMRYHFGLGVGHKYSHNMPSSHGTYIQDQNAYDGNPELYVEQEHPTETGASDMTELGQDKLDDKTDSDYISDLDEDELFGGWEPGDDLDDDEILAYDEMYRL
jgi:hypothetical protein